MATPGPLSAKALGALPATFRILVVYGQTGAGKTRIIEQLVRHYDLHPNNQAITFEDNEAVCSHPDLGLDQLQAVGLNSVPCWLKPLRCLSTGQQQRVESAIRASTEGRGILYDDFCCYVDQQSSFSCAASIYRLVRDNSLSSVIVGTSRADLIPYLGADIVIEAASQKICPNPLSFLDRKMLVKICHNDLQFQFGKGCSGWEGPVDDAPLRKVEDFGRTSKTVPFATIPKSFATSVKETDRTAEAAHTFDYSFAGKIQQEVHLLKVACLPGEWHVGALCGPSGSGKSVNMRNLGKEAAFEWTNEPVEQQVDGALLDVVLLPLPARKRRFAELSAGEKMQVDLARKLAVPRDGKVMADEFTSVLDRQLSARLCASVASYVRQTGLQLVVATVHMDVVSHLQPDWLFRSDYPELILFSGTCDRPVVLSELPVDYFAPPERVFTLARFGGPKETREAFQGIFEKHHYLKGGLPTMWGLMVRDELQRPVGFHAVAWQTGCSAPREARVVVLPEYQGMGLGTRLSDTVAGRCGAAGYGLMAKTKHPRLGGYRNGRSDLWKPTNTNGKVAIHSLQTSLRDMRARQKQVKGQQQLSFACAVPRKAKTQAVALQEPRRCFSHVYVGHLALVETPKKRKKNLAEEEQPTQPKKHGRPRKNRLPEANAEADRECLETTPARPKKRGRPRKNPEARLPPSEPAKPTDGSKP